MAISDRGPTRTPTDQKNAAGELQNRIWHGRSPRIAKVTGPYFGGNQFAQPCQSIEKRSGSQLRSSPEECWKRKGISRRWSAALARVGGGDPCRLAPHGRIPQCPPLDLDTGLLSTLYAGTLHARRPTPDLTDRHGRGGGTATTDRFSTVAHAAEEHASRRK